MAVAVRNGEAEDVVRCRAVGAHRAGKKLMNWSPSGRSGDLGRRAVCGPTLPRESPGNGNAGPNPMSSSAQSDSMRRNPALSSANPASRRPPGMWEDVEIDRELRRAGQLIRQCASQTDEDGGGGTESRGRPYWPAPVAARSAGSGPAPGAIPEATSPPQGTVAPRAVANRQGHGALVPWIAGAVLLVVGLAFLAIAVVQDRPDWWQPGLPLAILGQASLSLGIVLKLDFLQRRSPSSH